MARAYPFVVVRDIKLHMFIDMQNVFKLFIQSVLSPLPPPVLGMCGRYDASLLYYAHSTNIGPSPVLETVILMQSPVLIRRLLLIELIVPNFGVNLLFLLCRHAGSRLMGTIIVEGWCLYLSDNDVHG